MKLGKIKNSNLSQLVGVLEDNTFSEKYNMRTDTHVWTMYVRPVDGVYQAAYLSDECELLVAETFRKLNTQQDDKENVESVINTYELGVQKIEGLEKGNPLTATIYTVAGAALLAIPLRMVGIVIGGLAGRGIYELYKNAQVSKAQDNLRTYLLDHNVLIGESALSEVKSGNDDGMVNTHE